MSAAVTAHSGDMLCAFTTLVPEESRSMRRMCSFVAWVALEGGGSWVEGKAERGGVSRVERAAEVSREGSSSEKR